MAATSETPPAKSSRTVLLIEDDQSTCDVIECHLLNDGFGVDRAADGESGLAKALEGAYDLVILDLNLPLLNGIDVCTRIRESRLDVPIIMLTSRSSEIDKVIGLEIGADDYVVKPFSIHELMARVRARLRWQHRANKSELPEKGSVLSFGPLAIDMIKRKALLNCSVLPLTLKEFDVLAFLANHPGRPFSRSELLHAVWGLASAGYEDNVTQLVVRLRKKLELNPDSPLFIKTVMGIGYRFIEQEELDLEAQPADSQGRAE